MLKIEVSFDFESTDSEFTDLLFELGRVRTRLSLWSLGSIEQFYYKLRRRYIERKIGLYIKNNMDYDSLL